MQHTHTPSVQHTHTLLLFIFSKALNKVEQLPSEMEKEQKRGKEMKKDTKMENEGSLFNLPIDVLFDIFSRLTAKALFDCRLVCKSWLKLVRDPRLAKLHLTRVSQNENPNIIVRCFDFCHYLLDNLESSNVAVKLNLPLMFSESMLCVVGSCNGLVCVMEFGNIETILYIFNPVTGEYVKLPKIYCKDKHRIPPAAFCYHPQTKEYKVLRSVSCGSEESMMIFTLGSNSWRNINNCEGLGYGLSSYADLNGSIHWFSAHFGNEFSIMSFDIREEDFRIAELPLELDKTSMMKMGVLRGCLSLSYTLGLNRVELWVMKEYGVKESWTKQFVIEDTSNIDFVRPLCILNNGSILLDHWKRRLISYDPESKMVRDARICKISKSPGLKEKYLSAIYGSVTHVGSLVSLGANIGALEGQQ